MTVCFTQIVAIYQVERVNAQIIPCYGTTILTIGAASAPGSGTVAATEMQTDSKVRSYVRTHVVTIAYQVGKLLHLGFGWSLLCLVAHSGKD